ncbi:unnamed protein product [Polarella glacialis]|uniref:Uncharacterized protein n=2 Tax=Polarella glacialis TaxID=89957 RepID=A0A813DAJ1_POLGL|nr:unnamed protein product [Polarella glacialis]
MGAGASNKYAEADGGWSKHRSPKAAGQPRMYGSQRRHTIEDVKSKLLDAGLKQAEVDSALSAVAASMQGGGASSSSGAGGNLRKSCLSVSEQEDSLLDAEEILDLIEEHRGKQPGTIPALAVTEEGSGFSTWVERCEMLLEEEDEANYVAKKQLAAQVRAYLANCAEINDKQQEVIRLKLQKILNGSEGPQEAEAPAGEPEEEQAGASLQTEELVSATVHGRLATLVLNRVTTGIRKTRSEGLGLTAREVFKKLVERKSSMPISKRYVHRLLDRFVVAWDEKYKRATLLENIEVPKGQGHWSMRQFVRESMLLECTFLFVFDVLSDHLSPFRRSIDTSSCTSTDGICKS